MKLKSSRTKKKVAECRYTIDTGRFPVLTSFAYFVKKTERAQRGLFYNPQFDILLDSGAYSAYVGGEQIKLDDYIAFCHKWKDWLLGYVVLDVIKDSKKTTENWREMQKQGLNPIPIHTVGHDQHDLDEMFDESGYVMLGGIFGNQANNREAIKLRHKWSKGRPVHWLGYGNEKLMRTFNPFSVDLTNWQSGLRFGTLKVYFGNGEWQYLHRKKTVGSLVLDKRIRRIAETCGFSFTDLSTDKFWYSRKEFGGWKACIATMVGLYSWIQYTREYRERFGTKILLAGVGSDTELMKALTYWINKLDDNPHEDGSYDW